MFCPGCGKEAPEGTVFCQNCGVRLGVHPNEGPVTLAELSQRQRQRQPQPYSQWPAPGTTPPSPPQQPKGNAALFASGIAVIAVSFLGWLLSCVLTLLGSTTILNILQDSFGFTLGIALNTLTTLPLLIAFLVAGAAGIAAGSKARRLQAADTWSGMAGLGDILLGLSITVSAVGNAVMAFLIQAAAQSYTTGIGPQIPGTAINMAGLLMTIAAVVLYIVSAIREKRAGGVNVLLIVAAFMIIGMRVVSLFALPLLYSTAISVWQLGVQEVSYLAVGASSTAGFLGMAAYALRGIALLISAKRS